MTDAEPEPRWPRRGQPVTLRQLHHRLASLADGIEAIEAVIASSYPQDEEGFPIIDQLDVADAVEKLGEVSCVLSRICFKLAMDGLSPE